MKLYRRLAEKRLSKYQVSKLSGIPYSTLNDLFNEKTSLLNATVDTLYKLSKVFEVSMEELLSESIDVELKRVEFDLFRSHIQHLVHEMKANDFLTYVDENKLIEKYFKNEWIEEALYLVAMTQYLCHLNKIRFNDRYKPFISFKLKEPLYPKSILLKSALTKDKSLLTRSFNESIEEFKNFNIVERDIHNVA